ncbi:MAG: hypothetical protein IJJ50_03765 [Lachnospiraceae bacterium]|nr:hypothetical protein [Lachnospiraceae bacterium]
MKKDRKYWRIQALGIILVMGLLLGACGGSSPESGASPSSGKTEEAAGSSEDTPVEIVGISDGETSEGAASEAQSESETVPEIGYDGDNVIISPGKAELKNGWFHLEMDLTNNNERGIRFRLYPLLINGQTVVSEGCFEEIEAGAKAQSQIDFITETLAFAGIAKIRSIMGYCSVTSKDDESEILGKQPVFLYFDENAEKPAFPEHSGNVSYDKNNVKISYLGSYRGEYSGSLTAVWLVSNDSQEELNVGISDENVKIDGEVPKGKYISGDGTTLPAGKNAFVTVYVVDEETYSEAPYETADAEFMVFSDQRDTELIPFHLTAEGDTVACRTDEPYPYSYKAKIVCDTVRTLSNDKLEEYHSYYHEEYSDILTGLTDEAKFKKSAGYTKDMFAGYGVGDFIKGMEEADFVEMILDEDDEYVNLILVIRDLDDMENVLALQEAGYWTLEDPEHTRYLSVEKVVQRSLEAEGAETVQPEEFDDLKLHTGLIE